LNEFLKDNVDVNARAIDESGKTALMLATEFYADRSAFFGSNSKSDQEAYEIITLLLKHGADVNLHDSNGNTALMKSWRLLPVFELLIQYGADIDHYNNKGLNLLMYALINNDPDFVRAVLVNGADPKFLDKNNGKSSFKDAQQVAAQNKEIAEMMETATQLYSEYHDKYLKYRTENDSLKAYRRLMTYQEFVLYYLDQSPEESKKEEKEHKE